MGGVDDELWAVIEPLLPKIERRTRHPGRKRHPDRLVFQGILFVLHTGIAWEHLPQEIGFGSGVACWRRLAEWTEAGVWPPRLHEALLVKLRSADALDFSAAAVEGSHIRALKGPPQDGTKPCRPGQDGQQAPPNHGRHWHPARRQPHRWQPQRRYPAHPAALGSVACAGGQAWPTSSPPPTSCSVTAATATTSTAASSARSA